MLHSHCIPNLGKPLVVFLHGFLGTHEDLLPLAKRLQADFSLELIDLPGHGSSAFVENPAEVIAQKLQKPFHLAGYSLGGRLALKIASHNPLCLSLTLIGAHTGLDTVGEKKIRWEKDLTWCALLEDQGLDRFLEAWYSQPLFLPLKKRKTLYNTLLKRRKNQDGEMVEKLLRAHSLANDTKTETFDIPTLALYGGLDMAYATLYAKLPKQVKVVKIEKCGHAVPMEKPAACALAIKQFLMEISCKHTMQPLVSG